MRTALEAARRNDGLRRIHTPGPGKPPWPAPSATLTALLRHDLVDHYVDKDRDGNWRETWTINDNGRQALEPPLRVVPDSPQLMRCSGTTTRIMQGGVWREFAHPEPEKTRALPASSEHSRRLHVATRAHAYDQRLRPLTPSERYDELRALARERGVDVRSDLRVIESRLDAIERKVRRDAA